jgi:hypothetical protein
MSWEKVIRMAERMCGTANSSCSQSAISSFPGEYFIWPMDRKRDRSQKNRNTQGVEKHAPEAVFDGISRLGLYGGRPNEEGCLGFYQKSVEFLTPSPKMAGVTTDPHPKSN